MSEKEQANRKRMDVKQVVSAFLDGMSHSDIARKYNLRRQSVSNLLAREVGYLQMAHLRGKKPRKSIRERYINNWMTIAQGIVDRIGRRGLADKLGITCEMVLFVKRDIMSENAYFQLIHPESSFNSVKERKAAVKTDIKNGVPLIKIQRRNHISRPTLIDILNDTKPKHTK